MTEKATALRVVRALEADGLLAAEAEDRSRQVVERALGDQEAEHGPAMPKLVEVVAYLGGALVLAAGFLFLLQSWKDLGDVGQVSFLVVVAVVLGVAGVVTSRAHAAADVRRRLGGTLLSGSAVAAGFAVGVAMEVFSNADFHDVYWPGVVGSAVVVAVAAVGYRVNSTVVGLVAMLAGALFAGMNLGSGLAREASEEALGVAIAVFAIAAVWVLATEIGLFDQRTIARALGVAVALFGAQVASFDDGRSWVGYLFSLLISVVGVWLYLTRLDWPYLAAAVIAVTLVVPEAVSDWTDGSLGVVGGVLVAGITLLLASFAGYRLRRETTD